ncbi:hypothetical protein [Marinobacter salsuginis]|jgi:hypothetical protein|uniref:Uncharacterized protein n=1 Tax=Marinobacter salsuginis TaxID=418719 RepID=A0A5M3Q5E2_9GAMM|nr:hypothetical protein [Marinobacter salsuginis]GBO90204.1 hypothetical protein MSSD14B_38720 [Marinobacter salsuginis]
MSGTKVSIDDIKDRLYVVGMKLSEFGEFLRDFNAEDSGLLEGLNKKQRDLYQSKLYLEKKANSAEQTSEQFIDQGFLFDLNSIEEETHKFEQQLGTLVPTARH